MVELCVGVGMRRRLPAIIGEVQGPLLGKTLICGFLKSTFQHILSDQEKNWSRNDDAFIIPHFASTLTKVLVTKKKWNMMDLLSHLANKKIIPSISC